MRRIVIDTNVFVSGVMSPYGPPGRVLGWLAARQLNPLYDDRILAEYKDVLLRPRFRFNPKRINEILAIIEETGTLITAGVIDVTLPDQADTPFLEVATTGNATGLVTGNDKHYVPISGEHSIDIISPRDFVDKYGRLLTGEQYMDVPVG